MDLEKRCVVCERTEDEAGSLAFGLLCKRDYALFYQGSIYPKDVIGNAGFSLGVPFTALEWKDMDHQERKLVLQRHADHGDTVIWAREGYTMTGGEWRMIEAKGAGEDVPAEAGDGDEPPAPWIEAEAGPEIEVAKSRVEVKEQGDRAVENKARVDGDAVVVGGKRIEFIDHQNRNLGRPPTIKIWANGDLALHGPAMQTFNLHQYAYCRMAWDDDERVLYLQFSRDFLQGSYRVGSNNKPGTARCAYKVSSGKLAKVYPAWNALSGREAVLEDLGVGLFRAVFGHKQEEAA